MKNFPVTVLLTALVAAGCHNKQSASGVANAPATADATNGIQSSASDTPNSQPSPPAYIASKADNVVHQTASGEADAFMTGQLHIFFQQKGRMPVSFTEFANTRLDSIPRPPDGTKWAIDAASVEVKAVQISR
jgi:hypothetical protein